MIIPEMTEVLIPGSGQQTVLPPSLQEVQVNLRRYLSSVVRLKLVVSTLIQASMEPCELELL